MSDSDSSSLSSAPPTDDEAEKEIVANLNKPKGINRYFKPAPKPEGGRALTPPPKRAPSPPHEYVLADNPDIAFIVMFRARFHEAFPRSVPNLGPQDIERGVSDTVPSEQVERLLCGLLGLVLNRKKDVERGHYGRALEDAISTHSGQWSRGKDFNSMDAVERLKLLRTLVLWALSDSEAVQAVLKESYKSSRQIDDKGVGVAVVPWFVDTFSKRKYYLVEGQDDTYFRLYKENNAISSKTNTWYSVAGNIDEIKAIADKFDEETASQSKIIAGKIRAAVPRFEAGEEKRKRRDYRLARKAAFARPEPGFSLYEGRTRGKRMKYTFSDDDFDSDGLSIRRSTRNSGVSTPLEDRGPTITASGRQVKSRYGGLYGESMLVDQRKEKEAEDATAEAVTPNDSGLAQTNDRSSRAARSARRQPDYIADGDTEDESGGAPTEDEWSGNEDESDETEPDFEVEDDEDEEMRGAESDELDEEDENTQESLVVQLRYRKGSDTNKAVLDGTYQSPPNGEMTFKQSDKNLETQEDSRGNGDVGEESRNAELQHQANGISQPEVKDINHDQSLPNGNAVAASQFHVMSV